MSLNAYHRTRTITETPRGAEHRLMQQVTGDLMRARDARLSGISLMPALSRNREVWSALSNACAARGNALPDPLRASIVSLGLWVDRYSSDVAAGRDGVDALIDVNRAIIEGLQGNNASA